MIEIPERLKKFNFVLVGEDKKPFEKGWTKKELGVDDPKLIEHVANGGNYGVNCGEMSQITIEDKTYFLIIVDFDKKDFQDKIISKFPRTFTTSSNSPKGCLHKWFATDNDKSFRILDENLDTLCDVQGTGTQVICPGSKHSSGSLYSVVDDCDFAFIPYAEIEAILKPFDKRPQKPIKETKPYIPKGSSEEITSKIYNSISMEDILRELNIDTSKNPTECPFHASKGGKCFGWTDETAHCFHCDDKWNKFSLVRQAKNLSSKETFDWFAAKTGLVEELNKSREEYQKQKAKTNLNGVDKFGRWSQVEDFYKSQPFFYDERKIWWFWNKERYCYQRTDEISLLNYIREELKVIGILESKTRQEIINVLKQYGRTKIPKEIKGTWVQFKNKIYDISNNDILDVSPKFFIANPIMFKVGESEDTPLIDKYFTDWVGAEHKEELYEIVAFCCVPRYFIHRTFFFWGGGANGKSTFDNLITKFLGVENVTTSSIERLQTNSRFETAKFYKKLVVFLSEISVDELKKSDTLKRASGEEPIPAEIKGKDLFDFLNYAKILVPTNKVPKSTDDSDGFYRRIKIIDFPNQFTKEEDILSKIPQVEFENLSLKCIRIAKKLFIEGTFTGDGDITNRKKRYVERATTPLELFIERHCITNEIEASVPFGNFYIEFIKYLKEKSKTKTKNDVSNELKKLGWEVKTQGKKLPDDSWTTEVRVLGLRLKEEKQGRLD